MASKHKGQLRPPEPVAGNGLLDRRMLLGRGIIFASAAATSVGTSLTSAAAEPMPVDPWSMTPGAPITAYGTPSKYENKVVRSLTNPNSEPRTSQARTPHHLLQGTITPAGPGFRLGANGPVVDNDGVHGMVEKSGVVYDERYLD